MTSQNNFAGECFIYKSTIKLSATPLTVKF